MSFCFFLYEWGEKKIFYKKFGLLSDEYKKFNKYVLKNHEWTQYILNNLHIYDLNLLKIQDYTDVYNNYIDHNKNGCVFQFQNVFKNK